MPTSTQQTHLNDSIASFEQHGHQFWQPNGPYKSLHHINPARLKFIERYQNLNNKQVLDIGCGGGILSEAMASKGAKVSGIDISPAVIQTAKDHLKTQPFHIDYRCISSAQCVENNEKYGIITCMEMLEHVVDPSTILKDIHALLKDDGYAFFSTLNRTFTAYLLAIIVAENLTSLVPKGTHQHDWFIKPSELVNMCEQAGLRVQAISGLDYHPLLKTATLSRRVGVNYLLVAQKIPQNA